jgi:hypothetical protein
VRLLDTLDTLGHLVREDRGVRRRGSPPTTPTAKTKRARGTQLVDDTMIRREGPAHDAGGEDEAVEVGVEDVRATRRGARRRDIGNQPIAREPED